MHKNGSDLTKNSWISKNDIILIGVLLIFAMVAFLWIHNHQKPGAMMRVSIDGVEYGSYELDKDQEIEIQGDDFISILTIRDGKASMIKADCPDQICVHHRPISQNGETIICLPHRVVVEVEEINTSADRKFDGISQ